MLSGGIIEAMQPDAGVTMFTVTEVMCPELLGEDSMNMQISGRTVGDIAVYSCVENYEAVSGNTVRHCLSAGAWSGLPLQCQTWLTWGFIAGVSFACSIFVMGLLLTIDFYFYRKRRRRQNERKTLHQPLSNNTGYTRPKSFAPLAMSCPTGIIPEAKVKPLTISVQEGIYNVDMDDNISISPTTDTSISSTNDVFNFLHTMPNTRIDCDVWRSVGTQ